MNAEFPAVLLGIAAVFMLPMALIWAIRLTFRATGAILGGAFSLVGNVLARTFSLASGLAIDGVHAVGSGLTAGAMLPLTLGNLALGRPRAASNYGRAMGTELSSFGGSLYRLAIGHPARFFGLTAITDGLERRLPDTIAKARQSEEGHSREFSPKAAMAALKSRARSMELPEFAGYSIEREMRAGGSGARLYLANPEDPKRADWRAAGLRDPGQVVIKSFDLEFGSTLPQIVRENRALVAARRLGLVLDHELADGRFHYVMPFVPGEDLGVATEKLHADCGPGGLDDSALRQVVGFGCDVAATLGQFHGEGLWHKDVKPSNLIVSSDRVHVVDLGLVTPLASALTLTTHGTEYYRDPEMVRLAMQGVKVHEVDGVKFDLYSAGAVLYSMVENSFPAHGSLSRISKRCPDALAWIVRRCMADLATRYRSADELGRDLAHVLAAKNPYSVLPAELPSLSRKTRSALPPIPPPPAATETPSGAAAPLGAFATMRVARKAHRAARKERRALRNEAIEPRKRRVRTAAVVLGSVAALGVFAVAVDSNGHNHSSYANQARRMTRATIGPVRAGLRQASARARTETERALAFLESGILPAPRMSLGSATESNKPSVPQVLAEQLAGRKGGVLVLRGNDLGSDRKDLRGIADALRDSGREVYGLGEEGELGVSLEARALTTVGLSQPGELNACRSLAQMVTADKRLAAILWAGTDGDEDSLVLHIVTE
ncbi:MAG: serine/threonine protein kinase [Planctomycetota bacterium]|jgi:serine/threonine protein kinase